MSKDTLFEDKEVNVYLPEEKQSLLKYAVKEDKPTLLVGETGVGKTTMVEELAKERGKDLYRVALTSRTLVKTIVGQYTMKDGDMVWKDGPLVKAMKNGDWIVFDEINMAPSDILSKLHSLLENDKRSIDLSEKGEKEVVAEDGFRFFATMNPADEYAGTKRLNKAFKSRFLHIRIDYSQHEPQIIQEQSGVDEEEAAKLVAIANEIRSSKEKRETSYTCSTRDLIQCANMIANSSDIEKDQAYRSALIDKAPPEDRGPIVEVIEMLTGDRIEIAGQEFDSVESMLDVAEESKKKIDELKDNVDNLEQKVEEQENKIDELEDEKDNYESKYNEFKKKFENKKRSYNEIKGKTKELLEMLESINEQMESGVDLDELEIKEIIE